jgi:hypothetical protein
VGLLDLPNFEDSLLMNLGLEIEAARLSSYHPVRGLVLHERNSGLAPDWGPEGEKEIGVRCQAPLLMVVHKSLNPVETSVPCRQLCE